ncbi:MAG: peptidoglycan-binding protein [Lachnospiraceae bacterium]|nr:peptidoglycan-binding protein [Lachnospiraceae bacterium]
MGDLYNPFPKLPKNIRQIGDSEQVVRLYVEDYVNTYLKRLFPTGKQTLRVGLLLGNVEQCDGTPYIFVDGAMEMENVEIDGENLIFSENAWKKAYQNMEETFPKRNIQGWFLCSAQGSQLSPLNYWKQHGQYFAGKNQLMYLNHGLEGEESIYITSENGFYKLKGHYIYYERNQMMQDYMITRKDVRRVESGSHEKVIKDFRQRMVVKKSQADTQKRAVGSLGMLCGVLSVAVLSGGVVLVNNYNKMQQMESVLTSVLPAGVSGWDEYQKQKSEEPDFIIEELPGNVYPTETVQAETGESYTAAGSETVASQTKETAESVWSGEGDAAGEDYIEEAIPFEETTAELEKPESAAESQKGQAESEETPLAESGEGDALDTQPPRPAIDYEAAAANGYRIYEVGDGETLYGICWKEYGDLKKLTEICRLNYLDNVDRILAGQKLILP